MNLFGAGEGLPALQFAGDGAAVIRVVEADVLDPVAFIAQRLGKVAHGAEDQGDFLRMMSDVGRFLHDLDHQQQVVLGIEWLQGGQVERQLVAEDQEQAVGRGHGAKSG